MKSPVAITACSLLTPLDRPGGPTTWEALCAGERVGSRTAVAEELLDADREMDRSIRLALAAVNRLDVDVREMHLFCGTSKGPVTTFLAAANIRSGRPMNESQANHIALGVGAMGAMLRDRLNIRGPAHTSVAACSSGLHALHRAVMAVQRGECQQALVAAADASLHPLFEGSFARLGVLSPIDADGVRRCEPFSEKGAGFFLIEAAAAMVVTNAECGMRNAEGVVADIERTWIGGDSTGIVAIDEQTRTLRAGLRAFTHSGKPAFVHAHATGTGHDAYERAAIRTLFPDAPVFSHKKWLGHSLGAAGLVSVALSAMSHRAGRTPCGAPVKAESRSLTIAQGFGGHIGIVALKSSCAPSPAADGA